MNIFIKASLSFINGERLHMATNRKPPTGRDNEFQLPQDHSTNESLDIEFHSLILTKYHSAVDDDEDDLIKEEEQKSYCTSYQQTSILKSRDLQKQNINSISESKDNLFIQTQKGKENLISYFPNYINTQEYCHNKQQGSGNDSSNLKIRRDFNQLKYCYINGNNTLRLGRNFFETCKNSIPNNMNYSNKLGKNSEDKGNFIQCCTPKICSAVIESAMKYNNQYEINDEQDFKLNENLYQYLSDRFNVTSSKAKDIKGYRKLDCPYRTVSHFGFNLPLQEPAPDHKHSINFENQQKYIPLMRTASYEEIFSSARYLELCEYCFEYLVRLKPELMKKYKTKLRNLAKHSACNKLNFRERYFTSSILNRDHHNITNEGKYKFEFGDHNDVAFSFKLDPIIEIDENFNDYLQTQSISNTTLNGKVNRINLSEQARSDKIFITPNTISSQINLSKDVDDNNVNLLSHSSTSFNANGNIEDYNLSLISCNNINVTLDNSISLTEIWEFDDWLNTVIDMNQNIKLQNSKHCENVSNVYYLKESPRKLMNREERWRRKLEFQEIWEDHVNFAQNRECSDMELAENGEQQDVSIERSNQSILFDIKEEEEEVFNGHCLLFPYFSLFNKKCFDENHKHLQEINNLSEGCTLLTTSNMTYNIAEIKSSDENLFSPNFDSSNIANTEDYVSLRKKISSKSKVCDSYEDIRNQASVVDEKHGRNSLIDFSKMSFNENRDEFSPLERTILEKIHTNNLSKNNTIFRKIESSIRNKMTPYKMGGSLMEEKTVFLENKQKLKDKENEDLNLLSAVKSIRLPCSLTSHVDNIELPSYKLKKTNSRVIKSHNKPPKSTENHKKIISISPYLQSVNLNEKSKCRNFILENIRNAAIPRQKAQIKRKKNNIEQKLKKIHSITPTPSTNKFGSTKKLSKNMSHKAETPQQFIYSREYNIPSAIYSFQSKLVKGSPRLWISIPQSSSTQNQSIITPKLSCISSKSSNIRDSDVNITIVDEEINALGKEIEQIQPRLENYKRKLDDFGNRVTECVHNINECISTHEKTISEQQKLKDRIVLHQYAEDIMCRVQTFSLSETED